MAQWNITTQDYLNQERSLFEVVGVASSDGQIISSQNPFPVTGKVTLVDDSGSSNNFEFTSKNRLKTSIYQTAFFNTFQYSKEADVWDERVTGIATATHSTALSLSLIHI